ncbi:hypothetical protein PENTCL1PPCAC_27783, partial [Pristionchus entomophagus]
MEGYDDLSSFSSSSHLSSQDCIEAPLSTNLTRGDLEVELSRHIARVSHFLDITRSLHEIDHSTILCLFEYLVLVDCSHTRGEGAVCEAKREMDSTIARSGEKSTDRV